MKLGKISLMYFSNEDSRGGAEEHILALLRGLDRSYFRPHLVCTPLMAEQLAPDMPGDVEVFPLVLRKPMQVTAAFALASLIRGCGVDIMHSHLFYASLFASPIAWLCHVPVVIETPHVREAWRHGWRASYFIDRAIGYTVDRYVAVSQANARYLMEEKRIRPEKITVIRNGCDLTRFHPFHVVPAGMKEALGFRQSDPVIAVIGRLEPQKGHRILVDALQIVRTEFPQVRLVCVGDGSLRAELETYVSASGLDDAVRFVGFQGNIADWFALADMTVLPSFFEGLPIVAIEALAAARPVVATAVDGTPEIVVDGRTGFTVGPGDPSALANAIQRLLRDPELCQALGRNGRQFVVEEFDVRKQVQQTQDLYLHALASTDALGEDNPAAKLGVRGVHGCRT